MANENQPVLILGAGINGAAVARELLLNGVSAYVVDTADIASGATSHSSRLIHGGLRYLEHGEFGLVREALAERSRLLQLAPHFVKPLRLYIPTRSRFRGLLRAVGQILGLALKTPPRPVPRGAWLVRMGLWFYDTYARDPRLPQAASHQLNAPNVPQVDTARYRWLNSFYDAQIEYPERFVLAMLEDARQLAMRQSVDFRLWTYHEARLAGEVVDVFPHEPLATGRATTSRPKTTFSFRPSVIVNATGAWVDHTLKRLAVKSKRLIGGTKGSHILTNHEGLLRQMRGQGIYAEAADGRPVFVMPFGSGALIGTTDLPFDGFPDRVDTSREEIDYLLDATNQLFPGLNLTREDIHLHHCGVRPLPFADSGPTASITRRHWLEKNTLGAIPVFSVIGGKLTTCRSLAETTASTVLEYLGKRPTTDSRNRPIPGGESYPTDEQQLMDEFARMANEIHVPLDQVRRIWSLIGTRTLSVLNELSPESGKSPNRSPTELGATLPRPFLRWVIRNEWVSTLSDLVERRLMLIYDQTLNRRSLHELAQLMVDERLIHSGDVDNQVQACVDRLSQRYGKRIAD